MATAVQQERIVAAANDWMTDREPKDIAEVELALAVAEAFPESLQTKASCTCGESDTCDECPDTPGQVIAALRARAGL